MKLRAVTFVIFFVVRSSVGMADDSELVRGLLQEYAAGHAGVRRYYCNIAVTVELVDRDVAQRRLTDGELVPNPELGEFRRRFRCVVRGSAFQVQHFDDYETWHLCEVAKNEYPVFNISRYGSERRLRFPYDAYEERERMGMRWRCGFPWAVFCIPLSFEAGFPTLEEFLRRPEVMVTAVAESRENDEHLLRIDFNYQRDKRPGMPPTSGSVWLNLDRGWVIVRGRITGAIRVEKVTEKLIPYTDTWTVEYAQDNSCVPKVRRFRQVYHSIIGPDYPRVWLYTSSATCNVLAIEEDVSQELFTVEDFGFTRWDVGFAWLRWFWMRYYPPVYFYYAQVVLVVVMVPWIAYRRWRRRLASGSGVANASA